MFQPVTPGPPPHTPYVFGFSGGLILIVFFKGADSHPTEEVLGLAGIEEVAHLMLQEILATQTHSSLRAESDLFFAAPTVMKKKKG